MKIAKLSDISVSCYRPLHIYNKYIGRDLVVPCRECEACLKAASSRLVSRIENLRSTSAMCLFFTLTYDDEHVPVARFCPSHCEVDYYSVLHKSRFKYTFSSKEYENALCNMSDLDYKILRFGAPTTVTSKKFSPFCFSVLRKKDLQLFFKRFRKLFNYAFPTQDFKYFAIGEYGVRTFRAHYHGIIFLDNTVSFDRLQTLVRMSWKLGLVDVQSVSSTASSYCASYLSAFGLLPSFLQNIKAFKPFHTQSNSTVFEFFPKEEENFLSQKYFQRPFSLCWKTKSGYSLRPLSTSLRLRYFPLCTGFYQMPLECKRRRLALFSEEIRKQKCEPKDVMFRALVKDSDNNDVWLDFPYSVIHDLRKKFGDKTKKSDYFLCNKDFTDIYNSRRIYDLSLRLNVSVSYLIDYIISFYVGSSDILPTAMYSNTDGRDLPSSNFQLSLLRVQYSAMEFAENDDDLRFLYSFFDGKCVRDSLRAIRLTELDSDFAALDSFETTLTTVRHVVDSTCEPAIKHKSRNSYYQLLNK